MKVQPSIMKYKHIVNAHKVHLDLINTGSSIICDTHTTKSILKSTPLLYPCI